MSERREAALSVIEDAVEEHDLQTTIQGCEAWHSLIQEEGYHAVSERHHLIGLAQLIKDCHRWLERLSDETPPPEERGGER